MIKLKQQMFSNQPATRQIFSTMAFIISYNKIEATIKGDIGSAFFSDKYMLHIHVDQMYEYLYCKVNTTRYLRRVRFAR